MNERTERTSGNASNAGEEGRPTQPSGGRSRSEKIFANDPLPSIAPENGALTTEESASLTAAEPVMPSVEAAKSKWRKDVQDAGVVWSRFTETDLMQLQAHEKRLADLVEARYGVSRAEADRQVLSFIVDHQSSSL